MDERLEKALEFGNYRQTLANQKRNIKSRMDVLQKVHYNKGAFDANPQTISFVKTLVDLKRTSAIIVDSKDNLIEVEDLKDFLDTLVSAYIEATNEGKIQLDKIARARNVKKLMDW